MSAEQERAKVVAFLREDAASVRQDLTKLHRLKLLTPAQTRDWETMIAAKIGAAEAIERGEHLKDTPDE